MVHKILMDPATNRARGLLYVDRVTKKSHELTARAVILCAQSQESTRILLNSGTREHPTGLANSSGALGHYLTAHVRSGGGRGDFPELSHKKSFAGPNKPVGIYVARFRNLKNDPPYKKFLRGYGYEGESASNFNFNAPGFGTAFKQSVLQSRESFEITGFGEVLPRFDNFVEIDAEKKDIFGIPVLKIHMSDARKRACHDQRHGRLRRRNARSRRRQKYPHLRQPERPALGPARSRHRPHGRQPQNIRPKPIPANSRRKKRLRDGRLGFTTNPCQNPTLTIMALTVRSCDHLLDELKHQNL